VASEMKKLYRAFLSLSLALYLRIRWRSDRTLDFGTYSHRFLSLPLDDRTTY